MINKETISVIINAFVCLVAIKMVPKIKEIAFNKSPTNCHKNKVSIVSNSVENKTWMINFRKKYITAKPIAKTGIIVFK